MNEGKKRFARFTETKRFVVSVDHQVKRSFDTREEADTEANRISTAFPVVSVAVTDMQSRDLSLTDDESEKAPAE